MCIRDRTNSVDKVKELQGFLGVTSLFNVANIKRYQTLYRQKVSKNNSVYPEALASWIRIGEIEAQKIVTKTFDEKKLRSIIPTLRSMSLKAPEEFQQKMIKLFANAGVALVIVQHIPKTCAHGAAFWLNKDKAVIMITIRGKWADIFWFSLFHELAHILLHKKQDVFIESDRVDYISKNIEAEADNFASDNLIPLKEYKGFIENDSFFNRDIIEFASEIGIHPGIIVGRLHHDGKIPFSQANGLRTQFTWDN